MPFNPLQTFRTALHSRGLMGLARGNMNAAESATKAFGASKPGSWGFGQLENATNNFSNFKTNYDARAANWQQYLSNSSHPTLARAAGGVADFTYGIPKALAFMPSAPIGMAGDIALNVGAPAFASYAFGRDVNAPNPYTWMGQGAFGAFGHPQDVATQGAQQGAGNLLGSYYDHFNNSNLAGRYHDLQGYTPIQYTPHNEGLWKSVASGSINPNYVTDQVLQHGQNMYKSSSSFSGMIGKVGQGFNKFQTAYRKLPWQIQRPLQLAIPASFAGATALNSYDEAKNNTYMGGMQGGAILAQNQLNQHLQGLNPIERGIGALFPSMVNSRLQEGYQNAMYPQNSLQQATQYNNNLNRPVTSMYYSPSGQPIYS